MEKKNKLIFSEDRTKAKLVLKDGTVIHEYDTMGAALRSMLDLVKEKKIEGEEFMQWIGLILSTQNFSGNEPIDPMLPFEIGAIAVLILRDLKEPFFAIHYSGQNKGTIFFKGGRELRFLITSKYIGYEFVWLLERRGTISHTEAQKLIVQIEESSLSENNDEDGDVLKNFKDFPHNN